ncbi:hypothetical protein D9M71_301610 [compost metagenome]
MRVTSGSSIVCGKSARICPMASRMSLAARSGSTPSWNSTVVTEMASAIVEVM